MVGGDAAGKLSKLPKLNLLYLTHVNHFQHIYSEIHRNIWIDSVWGESFFYPFISPFPIILNFNQYYSLFQKTLNPDVIKQSNLLKVAFRSLEGLDGSKPQTFGSESHNHYSILTSQLICNFTAVVLTAVIK